MPRPEAEVIERGSAAQQVKGTYTPIGVTDEHGNEYFKVNKGGTNKPPPPPRASVADGGDGSMRLRLRLVEIGLGVLAGASALGFWFVMERMDNRFDRVDEPLHSVQASVAAQTEVLKSVNEKLSDLKLRMDMADGRDHQTDVGQVRKPAEGNVAGR
jgi:hypothetical protein